MGLVMMANRKNDYSIYLVTDQTIMTTATLSEAVEQAILGGCTMVQLREKTISTHDYYAFAKEIKDITDRYNVPLIINDRIDVAMAVNAAGVHLGQSDMPAAIARRIIGNDMILGVSATTKEEAEKAVRDGADYLGVGAMYPTGTKTDAKLVTVQELTEIRRQVKIPIVAIGGINRNNAIQLAKTGIDGLAIVSAIIAQPDIEVATKELKSLFTKGVTSH